MSQALLRPLVDRLWTACRSATLANPRAYNSLVGIQNVGAPPAVTPGMRWGSRMELPEESEGFVAGMELMAVPKRKVTPSRKGKRNGGKFLRSVPVIAKCTVCGRVKLPQFYCCDGQMKS